MTPKGNFSVSQARDYRGFPVFYPGESINGDELTAVARDPLGPMRQNQESVLFTYGTCEIPAGAEGGCSLPVSVSNEPACSRNLAMYSGSLSPKPVVTRVRGATAAFFEGGSRLEIQTGTTTVVIFAFAKRKALSVARNCADSTSRSPQANRFHLRQRGTDGTVPCPKRWSFASARGGTLLRKAAFLICSCSRARPPRGRRRARWIGRHGRARAVAGFASGSHRGRDYRGRRRALCSPLRFKRERSALVLRAAPPRSWPRFTFALLRLADEQLDSHRFRRRGASDAMPAVTFAIGFFDRLRGGRVGSLGRCFWIGH